MQPSRFPAALAASLLALQPVAAAAQQTCVSEAEVGAIAIYSVPGVVQAVKLRCAAELDATGFLARRGDAFSSRYTALQTKVWPRAKSGLLKMLAGKAGAQGEQNLDTVASLPDTAVRPLVDALIVQEVSPRIAPRSCQRIEWVLEAVAPIDPELAGGVIGAIAGLVDSDRMPVCPRRS